MKNNRPYIVYKWKYDFTQRDFEGAFETLEEARQRIEFCMKLDREQPWRWAGVYRVYVDD